MTFAELEYDSKKRRTRREIFLEKMEGLIPWQQLEDRIEPFYAKAGRGRRPYPLGVMLRVHCVQLFYNLSDPGMEDLLYEVESVRRFAGLRLSGSLPDETTILNFRHLLETQGLGMGLFEEINVHLASLGHRLKTGTIVDASIIDAHVARGLLDALDELSHLNPRPIAVRAGTVIGGSDTYDLTRYIIHHNYDGTTNSPDIGILISDTDLPSLASFLPREHATGPAMTSSPKI